MLNGRLAHLVKLVGPETGWILLSYPEMDGGLGGSACVLADPDNLPPASDATNLDARKASCDCQAMCNEDGLARTHNTLRCRRLASAGGDRLGLGLHAPAPFCSGDSISGILNVAGPDWSSFSAEALALMTNLGYQS